MNAHLLEALYQRLGQPAWFWPAVLSTVFGCWILAGSIAPEVV